MSNHSDKPYMGKRDPRDDTTDTESDHEINQAHHEAGESCEVCCGEGGITSPCPSCGAQMEVYAFDQEPDRSRPCKYCIHCSGTGYVIQRSISEPLGVACMNCDGVVTPKGRGPRITPHDVDMEMTLARDTQFHRFPHTTTVVCCVTLSNGFSVVGKAAAVSEENFDYDIGCRVAREDVENQLWELLGFRLKQALHDGTRP